ncbi:MAG: S-adenosylmethionine:tRNA ribosyltransferase-isomerase [Chitinophagaceae bacterium]|nr:S-adenosylmethionine:tRNA ribosyltransferase-isomerase [Chitinophagaceae bacterium]
MTHPKNISIQDFSYHLPDDKIAVHPLPERDASKILIYKAGNIITDIYKNIADYLPEKSLLVFNNTKVINARIKFIKPTGGVIEIFCLEPLEEYTIAMAKKAKVCWKCMIGGAGKWKEGVLEKQLKINNEKLSIQARLIKKLPDAYVVEFLWDPAGYTFAEVIEVAGNIPLPPYIKRHADTGDTQRYQTTYAMHPGSVAAPTAGLHFTNTIFNQLENKKIKKDFITLHVGAGTFKPVKADKMEQHEMNAEWIDVSYTNIENIISSLDNTVVAVGTTSLRTLETLYWLGVKVLLDPCLKELQLTQWEAYEPEFVDKNILNKDALNALLQWLKKNNLTRIFTQTQIIIAPGYIFKIANAIITNFHQPHSTLLLLVAAATGGNWRNIYDYALQNDFRFLSYGDGSLIFI